MIILRTLKNKTNIYLKTQRKYGKNPEKKQNRKKSNTIAQEVKKLDFKNTQKNLENG